MPEVRVFPGGTAWLDGGDAISIQAEGREDDRGGKEEGGEAVTRAVWVTSSPDAVGLPGRW